MKLYKVDHTIRLVELPKDAPTDVVTALGDELTGGNLNFQLKVVLTVLKHMSFIIASILKIKHS